MNPATVFDFPEAKGVVISGDIHGEFNELVFKCCVQYGMTDTVIIVAGDCGFGFERQGYYENVYNHNRGRLSKSNNWVLFIRGNHDNPAYFNDYPIKHHRWMTVPDYSVVRASGHEILCVGGAISVDRSYRMSHSAYHLPKKDEPLARNIYWTNESPVFDTDKLDAISEDFAIDTVVTHTAPSFCELTSKGGLFAEMAIRDEDLTEDVNNERQVMDKILDYLTSNHHPLRYWFYGHFHQSWQAIDNEGVQYNMLDIMELKELWTENLKKMITEKMIAYMVNLHSEDTGINTVIWVSHKCPDYKPFIMASTSTGKVLISIEEEPKVLQPNKLSDGDDISSVIQWIRLNKEVLLAYWEDDEYPTSKMLKEINKV